MKRSNNFGFTVIELLIAIAVFGITVPGMVGLINTINGLNDRARDLSVINGLVENKVESLRSVGFVGLVDGTYDFANELPVTITPPRSANYVVSSATGSMKQIDITITYHDYGGNRTVAYRSYIGELGVGQY